MLKRLLRNPLAVAGGLILLGVIVLCLGSARFATANPVIFKVADRLRPPSSAHLLGTDHLGRDLYSRLLYGGRISLGVAGASSLLALLSGGIVGITAGLVGGRTDLWIMRGIDALLAFPSLLLAIGLSAALGQGAVSIGIALWLVYLPRVARLWRSTVMRLRDMEFVQAARSLGGTPMRVALRHVVPNALSPVIVQATAYFSEMVLAEASLSFLGLGSPPPTPTWGGMLSEGRDFFYMAPWISIFPGAIIFATVLSLNLLGDGLRDALSPRG